MTDTNINSPLSRPSSLRRIRKNNSKDATISLPTSRPSSRPSSRPVSPTGYNRNSSNNNNDDDDQIIPTAIVIKNIPFSVKKDALLSKLASMDVPAAYAFNYHFDNGVFRGLAFANYKTPEETEIVVNTINGLEIGGRKLRVEYKKMLPNMMDASNTNDNRKKERDASASQPGSPLQTERRLPNTNNSDDDTLDLNDPNVLELYSFLLLFRGDPNSTEIALPKTLSAKERRDAHLIADRLGLAHYSEGFGADRQVLIEKRGSVPAPIVRLQHKNSRGTLKSSPSRERLNMMAGNNDPNNNNNNNNNNKRDSYRKSMMSTSTTAPDLSSTSSNSNIIHPIRQPRGPEPGKNFASRMNNVNVASNADQLSDSFTRQLHVGA